MMDKDNFLYNQKAKDMAEVSFRMHSSKMWRLEFFFSKDLEHLSEEEQKKNKK